jgi:hypothetical protein
MWHPFDVRFENHCARLRFHQQVVRDELAIFQAKQSMDSYQLQSEKKWSEKFQVDLKEYRYLLEALNCEFSAIQIGTTAKGCGFYLC